MLAAAKVLEQEENTKILVLGDIFELGDVADDEHYQLGKKLATLEVDAILTVGNHMAHTTQGINDVRKIATHFEDKSVLLDALQAHLRHDVATVLFKGSRGMKMESLIDDLINV